LTKFSRPPSEEYFRSGEPPRTQPCTETLAFLRPLHLESAKHRFALRLKTVDKAHPLVRRIPPAKIKRGRGAGTAPLRTKVQRLGVLLPHFHRPVLTAPRFTPGCHTNPTGGLDKKSAAEALRKWLQTRPGDDILIYSDGSETEERGTRRLGYGYAIFRDGRCVATGKGGVSPSAHVFDAEAIGAFRGLRHALTLFPEVSDRGQIWSCIDSTSVIWGLRGTAPDSAQWAFLSYQKLMDREKVQVKWCPGHMGIEGNEVADKLAKEGSQLPPQSIDAMPTVSSARSLVWGLNKTAQQQWWARLSSKLSARYRNWELNFSDREPPALSLKRPVLHHYLAVRTGHGDFAWYHRKWNHEDANLRCSCGEEKAPNHLVWCRKTQRTFARWPCPPQSPPQTRQERMDYLRHLMAKPADFQTFLDVTGFFTRICPR
jgi:ribonuclease HI